MSTLGSGKLRILSAHTRFSYRRAPIVRGKPSWSRGTLMEERNPHDCKRGKASGFVNLEDKEQRGFNDRQQT